MQVRRKTLLFLIGMFLVVGMLYGAGRAYFYFTDGFRVDNISSDLALDERWRTRQPTDNQWEIIEQALAQPYHYLGKGCQSYVFASQDGQYVIKFIKYQRYKNHVWVDWIGWIPPFDKYKQTKVQIKKRRLENLLTGWVIASEELQAETGIVYVHLNKTDNLYTNLLITDKLGLEHTLNLDDFEFMIQKRAQMLQETIHQMMERGHCEGVKALIGRMIKTTLHEYERGISDNDQALMQNTGVIDGIPIHIDVGQFVRRKDVQNPQLMKQQLFNRTFVFNEWLHKYYPELGEYLDDLLWQIIGPQIGELKYQPKDHDTVWEIES